MNALPATIPHAAEAAAQRWGDALALIEGSTRFTFAELWDECRRAASALIERGVPALEYVVRGAIAPTAAARSASSPRQIASRVRATAIVGGTD